VGEDAVKHVSIAALVLLALTSIAFSQQIQGDYVETRSADVYTGQCFANGEVNLVGNEAIMGWRVEQGEWNGVSLNGLAVVAVVRAKATLGDPYADPYPARSVLVVDDHANARQREALIAFARHMTGKLTDSVERVVSAPVSLEVVRERHGTALLRAGNFATVQTRPINDHDHLCGNEITFYPPLTQLSHSMPAVALRDEYRGPGLGETWSLSDKRSAFVGTFAVSGKMEMASAGE
jgi:hypothetical protein